MASILDRIRGPLRIEAVDPFTPVDPFTLQLQTAKEILREVFDISAGDVDEMIEGRLAERRGDL